MRLAVLLLIALLALGRTAGAQEQAATGFPYTVRFDGLDDTRELSALVRDSSALVSKLDDPPPSRAGLRRRAADDLARFETAARSLGYYDAEFRSDVEPGDPPVLVVTAAPGPVYAVSEIEIRSVDDRSAAIGVELPRRRIGLQPGAPARAADVLSAEAAIVRILQEQAYPLAEAGERSVLIDRDAKTMRVTFRIDAGPAARFGPVAVSGADEVDADYALRRLPWRYGETADIRKVERGRRLLTATGVYETVGVRFADAVGPDGLIPVEVTLTQRKPRSIGAGVSASTSEGAGVSAFWTHRNLFGGAERLDVNGRVSEVETSLTSELRLPDMISNNQDFILGGGLIEERTDGYDSRKVTVGGRFERRISDVLSVDFGATLERSRIEEDSIETQYTLVGLPVGFTVDTSDDLLNPTEGGRTRVRFTPYLETLGSSISFYSMTARHSQYVALDSNRDVVLAGRAAVGSIVGASTGNLPADKRLYSGGGGSVRGYGLQKIGPLDAGGDPIGGSALLEVGAELRWRVFGDFGIVPFIDGGQVYDTERPDLGQELQWAAGLGLRYYTPIGPVRADFAVPLNPRKSDDRYQVYFSLGQAF
ncbi:outer membrane protein assembly factor [Thalassobaculum fulvum]|uniref:Outer membrane protein assembly factor n=1 Tax=Thalassobaculum fulvum TaxID=1633335 RepID=A0A918XS40_9PROT|nr:autotransporter assembly complex family protein [Thalassobaculum fulvum]GHD50658.1 outer membrane protein assembly factor [Thalassobaculum fulvum]